jgi:hypothetical protein
MRKDSVCDGWQIRGPSFPSTKSTERSSVLLGMHWVIYQIEAQELRFLTQQISGHISVATQRTMPLNIYFLSRFHIQFEQLNSWHNIKQASLSDFTYVQILNVFIGKLWRANASWPPSLIFTLSTAGKPMAQCREFLAMFGHVWSCSNLLFDFTCRHGQGWQQQKQNC